MSTDLSTPDALLLRAAARELRLPIPPTASTLQMIGTLLDALPREVVTPALTPPREIDTASVAAYLIKSGLLPDGSQITTERAALGFSKDTYILEATTPQGPLHRLVMRRDLVAGCTRTTVVEEFPLLVDLYARGIPVPEPLLLEKDPTALAGRFIITRTATGRPDVQTWESDPGRRAALASELARIMARLHGIPIENTPLRFTDDPQATLANWLSDWRALWEEVAQPTWDCVPLAFEWLAASIPSFPRLAVVHADFGLHNVVVESGHVTALLDWEFAHAGDIAEDLAYAEGRLAGFVEWGKFLDDYLAAGGVTVSPERLDFYRIWRGVRNATCCALGLAAFDSGKNTDLRLAYAGRVLVHRYLGDLRAQLKDRRL